MKNNITAKVNISINAPVSKVWDALTKPEIIKQYFFGTDAKSDWKVGSSVTFKGEWEGKTYEDKGTVTANEPNRLLSYSFLIGAPCLAKKTNLRIMQMSRMN